MEILQKRYSYDTLLWFYVLSFESKSQLFHTPSVTPFLDYLTKDTSTLWNVKQDCEASFGGHISIRGFRSYRITESLPITESLWSSVSLCVPFLTGEAFLILMDYYSRFPFAEMLKKTTFANIFSKLFKVMLLFLIIFSAWFARTTTK